MGSIRPEIETRTGFRHLGQEPLEKLLWLLFIFFFPFPHSSPSCSIEAGEPHSQRHVYPPLLWEKGRNGFSFISPILSLSLRFPLMSSRCSRGFEYCQITWKKRDRKKEVKKKNNNNNNPSGSEIVFPLTENRFFIIFLYSQRLLFPGRRRQPTLCSRICTQRPCQRASPTPKSQPL